MSKVTNQVCIITICIWRGYSQLDYFFCLICRAINRGRRKVKMLLVHRLAYGDGADPTLGNWVGGGVHMKEYLHVDLLLLQKPILSEGGCIIKGGDEFWHQAWRRKWQPTPIFLPGKSHGQKSLVGYSPQGRRESGTSARICIRGCPKHNISKSLNLIREKGTILWVWVPPSYFGGTPWRLRDMIHVPQAAKCIALNRCTKVLSNPSFHIL